MNWQLWSMNMLIHRLNDLSVVAWLMLLLLLAGATPSANASFHLWQIKEVFSNADGSIQFIEMFDSFANENFIQNFSLQTDSDGSMKSFTFPTNIPLTTNTAGKHLLIATPGFAALPGAVAPDYTLPDPMVNGVFFNPNATSISISFSGSGDTMSFTGASLPKNGLNSLTDTNLYGPQNLVSGINSPTNINNDPGALNLGDYNRNRVVDGADYVLWRNTLTQAASPSGSGADGNINGTIDAGDFSFWRARLGNSTSGSGAGAASAAPEPAAGALWLVALLALRCGRRRRD